VFHLKSELRLSWLKEEGRVHGLIAEDIVHGAPSCFGEPADFPEEAERVSVRFS